MKTPVISIVTATYNRSNILAYSIQAVLGQTFTDWELIIVGDCCTDDTEAVIAAFNDPRITFINLKENFGEQSEPNNVGLRHAKGNYIAFLNHDDLWFPDHLAFSLNFLKENNADLVIAGGFIDHGEEKHLFILSGVISQEYGYHPSRVFVPASNWLLRSEVVKDVGFWRPAKELYLVPSHDWLKRVYEAGKRILPTKHFTVIAVPSSSRKNAYKDRQSDDNKFYFEQLKTNPYLREQLATSNLYKCFEKIYYDEKSYHLRFVTKKLKSLLIRLGWNTMEFNVRRDFGKGGLLLSYRKKRGLN